MLKMDTFFRFSLIVFFLLCNIGNAQKKASDTNASPLKTNDYKNWKTYKHQDASVQLPNYFEYGLLTNSGIQYYTAEEFDDVTIAIEVYEGNKKDLTEGFKASQKYPGATVSYKLLKPNWYVVSSNQSGTIHYEKGIIKGKNIHHLMIDYPENKKEEMDQILAKIARSFQ